MGSIKKRTKRKDDIVPTVVDRILKQIFGQEATVLIYRHLEQEYNLKRDEIGERIEVFAKGLEEFLRSGAYAIERKILEDIYSNYGLLRRLEVENVDKRADFVSQMKTLVQKA
jgi:hypothetical protein